MGLPNKHLEDPVGAGDRAIGEFTCKRAEGEA